MSLSACLLCFDYHQFQVEGPGDYQYFDYFSESEAINIPTFTDDIDSTNNSNNNSSNNNSNNSHHHTSNRNVSANTTSVSGKQGTIFKDGEYQTFNYLY